MIGKGRVHGAKCFGAILRRHDRVAFRDPGALVGMRTRGKRNEKYRSQGRKHEIRNFHHAHECGYASLPISRASRPDHSTSTRTRLPIIRSTMVKKSIARLNTTTRLTMTPINCAKNWLGSP